MKKLLMLSIVVLAFSVCMFAQNGDFYYVNYFSNAHNYGGYDATVRIINPGMQGSPLSSGEGTICANIYVFDTAQELLECCSCPVSGTGMRTLSINNDLTDNPLTAVTLSNGLIKIVASKGSSTCEGSELAPDPVPNLRAWATHLQNVYSQDLTWRSSGMVVTEDGFQAATLSDPEKQFLGVACSFVQYLGSTAGVCTCGSGGEKG